jgi:hypothetical protein
MKFWWGFHTFHFQNPTYSQVPTTLSLELHTTLFEEWQFCEGFFVKMYVNHIYIFFLVTIRHNKTMCASFIFFWFFFELVMLNPNQSKPLKTPQNPSQNPSKPRTLPGRRSLCVDGWDQALGLATVCIDPHETRWLVGSVGFGSASLVGASGPFIWIQRQELTRCMDQAYAVPFPSLHACPCLLAACMLTRRTARVLACMPST